LLIHRCYPTFATDPIFHATYTSEMFIYEPGLRKMFVTLIARKGKDLCIILNILAFMIILNNPYFLIFQKLGPFIIACPYARHLSDWTISRSLKLVYVMIELIRVEREVRYI
jgi:hypothetical protein